MFPSGPLTGEKVSPFTRNPRKEAKSTIFLMTSRCTSCLLYTSMFEHVFNKYPITSCGIVDQHMRYRTHKFSVLYDGSAAHSLDDSAGQGQKAFVRDGDFQATVYVVVIQMDPRDLYGVKLRLPSYACLLYTSRCV